MRRILMLAFGAVVIVLIGGAVWLYTPDKSRAELEARYAAPPSEFLDVAGLRLHARDTGPRAAPAIILLHGFGASLHTWDEWAAALQTDFRVIRLDLPGFGLTGADPTGDYSDSRSVAVLAALMDRLSLSHANLVGHSMGGRIAWTFAALRPERVDRLVLMAPDGFASPGMEYGLAPKVPPMVRALPYVLPMYLLRASLKPAYADPSAMTGALVARYRDMMLAPGVRSAIVARMAQNILVDPEPLLRRIAAPTLLLWGEKDAMIPFGNSADYTRDIKDVRLVALPGVGHLPQEEAPALSVQAIREFLTPK